MSSARQLLIALIFSLSSISTFALNIEGNYELYKGVSSFDLESRPSHMLTFFKDGTLQVTYPQVFDRLCEGIYIYSIYHSDAFVKIVFFDDNLCVHSSFVLELGETHLNTMKNGNKSLVVFRFVAEMKDNPQNSILKKVKK